MAAGCVFITGCSSGDDDITGAGEGYKLMWDEKVRVLNQRAFINGVDSKLHGQQLITTHSRLVRVSIFEKKNFL